MINTRSQQYQHKTRKEIYGCIKRRNVKSNNWRYHFILSLYVQTIIYWVTLILRYILSFKRYYTRLIINLTNYRLWVCSKFNWLAIEYWKCMITFSINMCALQSVDALKFLFDYFLLFHKKKFLSCSIFENRISMCIDSSFRA